MILGVVLIVLGVCGLGGVVYVQVVRPSLKKRQNMDVDIYEDEDGDGYEISWKTDDKSDTAEIDLNHYDAGKDDEKK